MLTRDEVNAEIARLRGWAISPTGEWNPKDANGDDCLWWHGAGVLYWHEGGEGDPLGGEAPDFCGSWALAGPLIEEMPKPSVFVLQPGEAVWVATVSWGEPRSLLGDGESPTEAIARAWLAWKSRRGPEGCGDLAAEARP